MAFDEDEEQEESNGDSWLVSYADLMTLLFAAFVVLYGITPQGESTKILGVVSSIREAFVEIPDAIPEPNRTSHMMEGKMNFEAAKPKSPLNPAIKKYNREQTPLETRDEQKTPRDILIDELRKGLGVHPSLRQAVQVAKDEFGVNLSVAGSIFFAPGSTRLSKEGQTELKRLAGVLASMPEDFVVEGHSTLLQKQPSQWSAKELSALRAQAVRRQLLGLNDWPETKVSIAAYGHLLPVASLSTAQGKAKNSRVVIRIERRKGR